MNWAPVIRVASDSGRKRGSLVVVDEFNVEWRRFGSVYRRYSMQSPVQDALFTRFTHAGDVNEVWVVIVCKDRLVHSYATDSGEHYVVGVTFLPTTILPCPEQGVLFTSSSPSHSHQLLHLLQGPEELLGTVVPSSVCAPLSKSEQVLFFNEYHAVVRDPQKALVRLYTVRFIHHRASRPGSTQTPGSAGSGLGSTTGSGSAGSAMSTSLSTGSLTVESINKVAVIQLAREWRQSAVGHIFGQCLSQPQGPKLRMTVVHDPVDDNLFTFCEGELIRHSDVTFACPVAGLHGIPAAIIAFKDTLSLSFLLFPQTPMLGVPVPEEFRGQIITGLESDPRANWVGLQFGSEIACCLQLGAILDPMVQTCIGIVQDVSGSMETAFWLVGLLTHRLYTNNYWEAFEATMENLTPEMDATQVSHIVTCLHLLREEYTLASGSQEAVRLLSGLIQRYVVSWGNSWTDYYGNSTSDSAFDIPRSMDTPPNIYGALIGTMQAHTGVLDYPDVTTRSSSYPKTSSLLIFFRMLSVDTPIEDMQLYIEQHFSESKLLELAPAARICIIEVSEYLDIDIFGGKKYQKHALMKLNDRSGHSGNQKRTTTDKWREGSNSRALSEALFPSDRRFNEAERLLQTKEAQQCDFGAFIDPEVMSDHEYAHQQAQWGRALAERSLASAFGRAALELGSRNPVVWEQLEVPAIEFSGECTSTGLSIPSAFKSVEQASAHAAWGIFAHGAALGLSIRSDSPGVNSLWVITSAKLKAASDELYAGLVFGMGLCGHLAGLEEWQFYESLVSSNSRGTVAALLGVAASKRGSRDTKLTKVFSVHIRALLPEAARSEPLVGPDEERAAILSLGLLYQGQGVRHLTEVFSRELMNTQRPDIMSSLVSQHDLNDADDSDQLKSKLTPSDDEDYSLAVGISLGLINIGKANLSQLLPLVTRTRDRTSYSPGVANGSLCAIMLSYVGTNAKLVATQVQLPSSRRAANYSIPNTLFAKALAHHLIMWDEIGSTREWVLAQVPEDLRPGYGESSEIESLWYMHALGGVLSALALRHTASNDRRVVGIVLEFIKSVFYPKYAELLKALTIETEGYEKRINYDAVQAAKNVAQLISALCLAVAATAAGSGDIGVLQVLRVAYQIGPQVQASERPQSALVDGVGVDPIAISEAIGWLFMGGGQWSFRADPESVGLLACMSFLPLLGGPGIQTENWHHLRFFWILVAERRCLHSSVNPAEQVQIEIVLKNGQVLQTQMPRLLPPLADIQEVRVADDRYRPFSTSNIDLLVSGLPIVRHASPQNTLEAYLTSNPESEFATKAVTAREHIRTALEIMQYTAEHMKMPSELEALRLVLAFGENWSALDSNRIVTPKDCEQLKLSIWRRANGVS